LLKDHGIVMGVIGELGHIFEDRFMHLVFIPDPNSYRW
jgi:hypothetical protein